MTGLEAIEMVTIRTRALRMGAALTTIAALGAGTVALSATPAAAGKQPAVINALGYPPPAVPRRRVKVKKHELRVSWTPPSKKPPYLYDVSILASDGSMLTWAITAERHAQLALTPEMHGLVYAKVVIRDQFDQESIAQYYEYVLP